jgi:hypothetical protein
MHDSALHRTIFDELQIKIKTLYDTIWERRHGDWPLVLKWLAQFKSNDDVSRDEQVQALYLLSNFLFFGDSEIRALLKSLYRDNFRPMVAHAVRSAQGGTKDQSVLVPLIEQEISNTRFVALGNPSESSSHLLYFFRQENRLPKDVFVEKADLFSGSDAATGQPTALKNTDVRHYVFIDDLCGSGHQAVEYSKNLAAPIRSLNPAARTYYYALFGLRDGISHIRRFGDFDDAFPVVEVDSSFRAFSDESRIYERCEVYFQKAHARAACELYGSTIWPEYPLGYEDGQLLLGFHHNTPDNTLPVFWADEECGSPWTPIFKRYPKVI